MKISSWNEWDTVKEMVVGIADYANWPSSDPVFALESMKTTWKDSPPPAGPVPSWIIEETNQDLDGLVDILVKSSVKVHRPGNFDFVTAQGMYNYCPRDRLLVAGDVIVDPAMMYPCRDMESKCLDFVLENNQVLHMPRSQGMILDAANIVKLNDTWLFLESPSGNRSAFEWLQQQFPNIKIETCNFYAGVHIDSTVVLLDDGIVMLNAHRVSPDNVPKCLSKWEKIWIEDCVPQEFYQYPYASKWVGMNAFSIDPRTVIVDAAQTDIIQKLEQRGFTVIPHTLRHSRTLGGGFHCVTLDTWRHSS